MRVSRPRRTPWAWTTATVCGIGYLQPGPGTFGSLCALCIWYLLAHLIPHDPPSLAFGTAFAAILVSFVGVPAATLVSRESGRRDPGFIVVDEVAGQLVALIFMPAHRIPAISAFILFRFFDILKPWPIRRLEALPEGAGIVLDDLGAGAMAMISAVLLRVISHQLH